MTSISRRRFVQTLSAAGAAVALPEVSQRSVAASHSVKVENRGGAVTASVIDESTVGALDISSTMPMASGAPLGGIGAGFIELRPDGCFHKWMIFNCGQWAGPMLESQSGIDPDMGPQSLQFLVYTREEGSTSPQTRRLYLRPHENNLYSMSCVQDIESIQYDAWFPMTSLYYTDTTLPISVSAAAFSPFFPGNAKESATPGFNIVFTLQNNSRKSVELSLLSLLDNPVACHLKERKLNNTISQLGATTTLTMNTHADSENKTTLGSLSLSVTGGKHSWISGTFAQYANTGGLCRWQTPRVNYMLLNVLQKFSMLGKLPNTSGETDPAQEFNLTNSQIDALSAVEIHFWLKRLSDDALLHQVISEARISSPEMFTSDFGIKTLLKEINQNLSCDLAGHGRDHSTWGTGALASNLTLLPGQKTEIRFTFSWFFPYHFSRHGVDMGHNYANWFSDAGEVNRHLVEQYPRHRRQTELFARTLADTSMGGPLAFAWSSHLSTAVTNTWWTKDGNYAIWEGLGCCGLSTMDVEYDGSFSVVALFPELKLSQIRWMLKFQKPNGQVPHTYDGDFTHIDPNGWDRVDMNPQYVMMVYRDYLWTADKDYLAYMWPHVVKAMDYTGSLDTNGDGLPDHNTSFQSYDQWGLRASPSYICSLWIGALKAAIHLAEAMDRSQQAEQWRLTLNKASENFDRLLFNGEYYSLWVDGDKRDETCMADQISGEWFSHLIGLPTTISRRNLDSAMHSIWRYNFTPETGLRNATVPRNRCDLLILDNLQAGGVWSGIEYAFASFMMDHGHFADGSELVAAVHRRYLRAGMPWNHVECGDYYSRPMSSWATLLAATGFKPNAPKQTLTITPTASGNFHAPWATKLGFGLISRQDGAISITCVSGQIGFKILRVNLVAITHGAVVDGNKPGQQFGREDGLAVITFDRPLTISQGHTLVVT